MVVLEREVGQTPDWFSDPRGQPMAIDFNPRL